MNRFAAIFLVLMFIMLISVGWLALQKEISLGSQAGNEQCPVAELPEVSTCADGSEIKLIRDDNDCLIFACP
jgi:hypothetical protein